MLVVEIVGYIASILVALSLTIKKILRLRIINLIGAVFFVGYAMAIKTYPVALVNAIICVINVAHLWKLSQNEDTFELLVVDDDSEFVKKFVSTNREEIQKLFPTFNYEALPPVTVVITLRNLTAVGIFIYHAENSTAKVYLDYVVPEYRDFKNARYLFSRPKKLFKNFDVHKLEVETDIPTHQEYLETMGFKSYEESPNTYVKEI